MKMKTLWIASVVVSVLAIGALARSLIATSGTQDEIIALEKRRVELMQLAARARQSTQDSGRMLRNFAVTGDARYEEIYQRILQVREGKAPWPPGDSAAYWDALAAGVAPPKGEGERLALAEALELARLPGNEQALLRRARAAQDTLAKLEQRALAAMKGQSPGGEAPPGQPDPVQALKILYGAEYLEAWAQHEQALGELQFEIELRTRGDLASAHQGLARDLQLAWLVFIGFAIVGLGLLLYTLWRGLRPLLAAQRHAAVLANGDYAQRTSMRALPEIEDVMRGLNEAATRLEAGARELDERDRYLEALLRTSPLGLLLVDEKNRVRWTSRRLREFLGDSKQDLKLMPFEQFFADPGELAVFRDALERKGRVREQIARIRRRDGSEFRARLDSAYVERSAERLAAVWVQAFGLHGQRPEAPAAETGA